MAFLFSNVAKYCMALQGILDNPASSPDSPSDLPVSTLVTIKPPQERDILTQVCIMQWHARKRSNLLHDFVHWLIEEALIGREFLDPNLDQRRLGNTLHPSSRD